MNLRIFPSIHRSFIYPFPLLHSHRDSSSHCHPTRARFRVIIVFGKSPSYTESALTKPGFDFLPLPLSVYCFPRTYFSLDLQYASQSMSSIFTLQPNLPLSCSSKSVLSFSTLLNIHSLVGIYLCTSSRSLRYSPALSDLTEGFLSFFCLKTDILPISLICPRVSGLQFEYGDSQFCQVRRQLPSNQVSIRTSRAALAGSQNGYSVLTLASLSA